MPGNLRSFRGFSNGQQIILLAIASGVLIANLPGPLHKPASLVIKREPRVYLQWAIEVTGSAHESGIYLFDHPPTTYEAVQKAGGISTGVPIASPIGSKNLESGTRVHVETEGSSGDNVKILFSSMDMSRMLALGIAIDVNLATVDELALIPGVGCSLARRVVEFREAEGPLKRWHELRTVKGVGPKKIEVLKDYVRLSTSCIRKE